MPKTDKRIDAYIAKAQPFAKPILTHLRKLIHAACPDVQETMKWSFPHFDYKGEMMCSMASFKQHCAFGFWKASLMKDAEKMSAQNNEAMGSMGRITTLKDLPTDKKLTAYIKEAMKLTDNGIKLPSKAKAGQTKEVVVPDYFTKALAKNKKAQTTFTNFSNSHKREYVDWITGAKAEETRNRRMTTAIEWLSEGKIKEWRYQKK